MSEIGKKKLKSEEINDLSEDLCKNCLELEKKNEDEKNNYLRLVADFENFKKRSSKDKEDSYKNITIGVVKKVLPVLDDLDRSLVYSSEKAIDAGVKIIHSKFIDILEKIGVKKMKIKLKNDLPDSNKHDVINMVDVEKEDEKGKVVSIIEDGYLYGDKVIRFAKVSVSK